MTINRRTVVAVTLLTLFAFHPAAATSVRSETRHYIGGYEAVAQVCGEYGTYDLGLVSVDTRSDLGSACFDLRGETRVDIDLHDIMGNVSAYYAFHGCENCGCAWCPITTDCPLCYTGADTGTWGFFCNIASDRVPAGATELEIIVLVNGPCESMIPPAAGSITVDFFA